MIAPKKANKVAPKKAKKEKEKEKENIDPGGTGIKQSRTPKTYVGAAAPRRWPVGWGRPGDDYELTIMMS